MSEYTVLYTKENLDALKKKLNEYNHKIYYEESRITNIKELFLVHTTSATEWVWKKFTFVPISAHDRSIEFDVAIADSFGLHDWDRPKWLTDSKHVIEARSIKNKLCKYKDKWYHFKQVINAVEMYGECKANYVE